MLMTLLQIVSLMVAIKSCMTKALKPRCTIIKYVMDLESVFNINFPMITT
jgi:hypothetical protein